ncbi:MAG: hypothetical protein ACOY0R_15260 [Chloroflexota bacterium]
MKILRTFSIAINLLLLVASGCSTGNEITDEEAVYQVFLKNTPPSKPVYLIDEYTRVDLRHDETLTDTVQSYNGKGALTVLSDETINDFIAKNENSWQLSPDMNLGGEYTLLPQSEKDEMFNGRDCWRIMRERYPDSFGKYAFSRVGFNRDRSQALIYRSFMFDGEGGYGGYCILEKEAGSWIIKDCFKTWKA